MPFFYVSLATLDSPFKRKMKKKYDLGLGIFFPRSYYIQSGKKWTNC